LAAGYYGGGLRGQNADVAEGYAKVIVIEVVKFADPGGRGGVEFGVLGAEFLPLQEAGEAGVGRVVVVQCGGEGADVAQRFLGQGDGGGEFFQFVGDAADYLSRSSGSPG
jgi:hypothetical protein